MDDDADPEPAPVAVDEEEVDVEALDFLLEERLTLVNPLKHRDNSAAALFVKLTSADMPVPVEPTTLLQAARITTRKQASLATGESPTTAAERRRSHVRAHARTRAAVTGARGSSVTERVPVTLTTTAARVGDLVWTTRCLCRALELDSSPSHARPLFSDARPYPQQQWHSPRRRRRRMTHSLVFPYSSLFFSLRRLFFLLLSYFVVVPWIKGAAT